MDNSQEIKELEIKGRWSGKRVVLLYWMSIMFIGTSVGIGLGTGVLSPKYAVPTQYDHSGITGVWHSSACGNVGCHSDELAEWEATEHGTTEMYNSTFVSVGGSPYVLREFGEFNMTCAHCMTTRWENGTIGDGSDVTYWDLGVSCASCHEPGEEDQDSLNCGGCHGGDHFTYEEYNATGHSSTLNNFADRADPSGCLKCLVGQAAWQVDFDTTGWNASDPTETAAWVGISCATCHDPHNNTHEAQLRTEDSTTLCGTCHGTTYSSHHQTNDTFFSGRQSHQDMECLDCHGYQLIFNHGDWEVHVNHSWVVDETGDACIVDGCHNVSDGTIQMEAAEEIMNYTKSLTAEWLELWEAAETIVNTANTTTDVNQEMVDFAYEMLDESEHLAHLVDYDHSYGFHNPGLAEGRLTAAIELAHMADALAVEAIATATGVTPEVTTVYETTTVTVTSGLLLLPVLAVLGLAALLVRKKRY